MCVENQSIDRSLHLSRQSSRCQKQEKRKLKLTTRSSWRFSSLSCLFPSVCTAWLHIWRRRRRRKERKKRGKKLRWSPQLSLLGFLEAEMYELEDNAKSQEKLTRQHCQERDASSLFHSFSLFFSFNSVKITKDSTEERKTEKKREKHKERKKERRNTPSSPWGVPHSFFSSFSSSSSFSLSTFSQGEVFLLFFFSF